MRAGWINLVDTYELLDECGAYRGTIITFDNQTHQRSLRALYEPPASFNLEDYGMLQKRVIHIKTA